MVTLMAVLMAVTIPCVAYLLHQSSAHRWREAALVIVLGFIAGPLTLWLCV